ncbi:MAG: 1-acyl-sn-glycerol-3-phosphate acyltransferase [Clostridia bacterium]|nr:1-acyl-sn-glycerol-3-phosphate acyltransferase [Clostridia bacterium]
MFLFWLFFVLLSLPILICVPVKIYGKKNYNKKKNYIIVSNHQSNFDPIILNFYLGKRIRFIAKKELFGKKGKSYFFDNILGCIPVDRSKGLSISETKKVYSILKDNQCLGLFPEGTRVSEESSDNMAAKNGACLFSIKTKTPILPCCIYKKQKLFKRNVFLIGKPFELSDFYDKKLDKETLNEASVILINEITNLRKEYENYLKEKELVKKIKKQKNKNI